MAALPRTPMRGDANVRSRRLAAVLIAAGALAAAGVTASAHVGTSNAYFDGAAGPYGVRVIVRTPGVIPGLAQVSVRVLDGDGVEQVTVRPLRADVGLEGAPPPDPARPVPGEAGLYSGELWLMTAGSYSRRGRGGRRGGRRNGLRAGAGRRGAAACDEPGRRARGGRRGPLPVRRRRHHRRRRGPRERARAGPRARRLAPAPRPPCDGRVRDRGRRRPRRRVAVVGRGPTPRTAAGSTGRGARPPRSRQPVGGRS